MKKIFCSLLVVVAGLVIYGCKSDMQPVTTQPANAPPPKGSYKEAIQNNPNIPDSAKRAMGIPAKPGK
ncbi:MAG: hypothetical protein P4L46_20790 [Fimbriimonas sp.]|nr:hypothetical protein [Fimbriimonas sp.]